MTVTASSERAAGRRVALVTLGCTRNEVDSEELAGRLEAEGWELVDDAADADVAVVNTCGFVEQAKKDSIDALLEAADLKDEPAAPRPSSRSAAWPSATASSSPSQLPEADAVLGFDSYADMSDHLAAILGGQPARLARPARPPHAAAAVAGRAPGRPPGCAVPGHGVDRPRSRGTGTCRSGLAPAQPGPASCAARLDGRPVGAAEDRLRLRPALRVLRHPRCSAGPSCPAARPTCSPRPAGWPSEGVRELFLVSENSTSYGKDLGDLRCWRRCCPSWRRSRASSGCGCPTCSRPRSGPACSTPWPRRPASCPTSTSRSSTPPSRCCGGCAGSAAARRSSTCSTSVRARAPLAGVRSNVIVGFPGETEDDVAELEAFLGRPGSTWSACSATPTRTAPRRRAYDGNCRDAGRRRAGRAGRPRWSRSSPPSAPRSASARRSRCWSSEVDADDGDASVVGRTAHQGPDVDGVRRSCCSDADAVAAVGDLVAATVVGSEGVDLVAARGLR